jgi:hypothetical protein
VRSRPPFEDAGTAAIPMVHGPRAPPRPALALPPEAAIRERIIRNLEHPSMRAWRCHGCRPGDCLHLSAMSAKRRPCSMLRTCLHLAVELPSTAPF